MHIYVHISVFTYMYICIQNPNLVSVLSRKIRRYFAILKFRKYMEKRFGARPRCKSIHLSARQFFRRLFRAIKLVERNRKKNHPWLGSHYPHYERRLIQYIYDCTFSASVKNPPSVFRGIWTSYCYHMYILTTILS